MKRIGTLVPVAALFVLLVPAGASAAESEAPVANWDHRTVCASAHKGWYNVHALRNDVGEGLRVVEVGTPDNGRARIHRGDVQYKDKLGNGTAWTYYTVANVAGETADGFFRVDSTNC